MTNEPEAGRPYTVVYDGTCAICCRMAALLRRWDRGGDLAIVASRDPGVLDRFPWIPAQAFGDALQLIGPKQATWSGAAAIEELLNVLPRGRFVSWSFRLPFVRGIADRFYRWFAKNRYRLGCGEHCPSRPPAPHRMS